MQILTNPTEPFGLPTAVMLGNFDGFHRAHRRLAEETVRLAEAHGLIPAAFCLTSPPNKGMPLCTEEEKAAFFKEIGIKVLFTFSFQTLRELDAKSFAEKILCETLSAHTVLCGYNYRFAKGRAADARTLATLLSGKAEVVVLPQIKDEDGDVISSSRIRALLRAGDVSKAEALLGHPLCDSLLRYL